MKRVLLLVLLSILLSASVSAFWFNGTTYDTDKSIVNNVNVSILVYKMVPGSGPQLNATYSTLSNTTGEFKINVTQASPQNFFYRPVPPFQFQ